MIHSDTRPPLQVRYHVAICLKSGNALVIPRDSIHMLHIVNQDGHIRVHLNGESKGEITATERDRLLQDLAGVEVER